MGLMDKVKAFFDKDPQNRELSSSVVTHDRLDDGYLDDIRERSTTFQAVIDNAPNVAVGEPPPQCPHCGHTDKVWWEVEEDAVVCKSCRRDIAMPEGPYSLWGDLVSDLWRSHFTHDEPKIKPSPEVKPSHELHRRVMSTVTTRDEFLDTRSMTRLDDVESAFAAMGTAVKVKDSIRSGALAEHARRAEQMAQAEQQIEQTERTLEDFRDRWDNNQLSDEDKQRLRELADEHNKASQTLATVQAEAQANPITQDVLDEIEAAVSFGQEQAEAMENLMNMAAPGVGEGGGSRIDPDQMFSLAERFKENDILQKVSELLGRLERDMRYRRANRTIGGFEEIVDIEIGDNIAHLLPMEYAKLMDPDLEIAFEKNFVDKSLLQFEIRGNEPEGKGPVVLCVDGSGSMHGERNEWARAVALAVVNIAHKERRDAAVIEFSSAGSQKSWFFPGRQELNIDDIIDCASHFYGGGTDICPAVREARKIMESVPEFKKADLCLITDGEDYYGDDDEAEKAKLLTAGVRIHGVAISEGLGYLKQMCENVTLVTDLSEPNNEATAALAENIT